MQIDIYFPQNFSADSNQTIVNVLVRITGSEGSRYRARLKAHKDVGERANP